MVLTICQSIQSNQLTFQSPSPSCNKPPTPCYENLERNKIIWQMLHLEGVSSHRKIFASRKAPLGFSRCDSLNECGFKGLIWNTLWTPSSTGWNTFKKLPDNNAKRASYLASLVLLAFSACPQLSLSQCDTPVAPAAISTCLIEGQTVLQVLGRKRKRKYS